MLQVLDHSYIQVPFPPPSSLHRARPRPRRCLSPDMFRRPSLGQIIRMVRVTDKMIPPLSTATSLGVSSSAATFGKTSHSNTPVRPLILQPVIVMRNRCDSIYAQFCVIRHEAPLTTSSTGISSMLPHPLSFIGETFVSNSWLMIRPENMLFRTRVPSSDIVIADFVVYVPSTFSPETCLICII